MDSNINICFERADNELLLSRAIYLLSEDSKAKKEIFSLPEEITFYSAVISHAYYGMFYIAKAYLLSKEIAIPEQGQHNAVYIHFKRFVKKGILADELLELYEEVKVKAEILLSIFEDESQKRTEYTYKSLPQANKQPSEDSIKNASLFISEIKNIIQTPKKNQQT